MDGLTPVSGCIRVRVGSAIDGVVWGVWVAGGVFSMASDMELEVGQDCYAVLFNDITWSSKKMVVLDDQFGFQTT